MPTTWPGAAPPFDVAAGYHPFVDYRYIHAGRARWLDAQGNEPGSWNPVPGPDWITPAHAAVPHGIRLQLQPAAKTDPFIQGDKPWEYWLVDSVDTVIRDGGRYRLWYEGAPEDLWDAQRRQHLPAHAIWGVVLCYAESDDGITWRKPQLGLQEWNGSRANNIVLGRELIGPRGLIGAAVFLDPTAPAHQRYKCLFMGQTDRVPGLEGLPRPGTPVDPMTRMHEGQAAIFAATSPDGLAWTVHHQPIAWHFADTGNVAEWDPALQRYVWYTRGWTWGRRTIARAETANFHDWPLATPLVTASPIDTPWSDVYTNAKTTYPGDPSTHLMFPTIYDRSSDTTSVVALASADNIGWSVIPGGPCLQPGPRGSVDGGCVFAGTGLVDLPGDRIGIPYGAFSVPHKHPPLGHGEGVAWATWPRGRLAGLVADHHAEFWTPPLQLHGQTLHLNADIQEGGTIRVELQDQTFTPLPNYTLQHSTPITGNHLSVPITWAPQTVRGEPGRRSRRPVSNHLPTDRPLTLRFQLTNATLYGFEVAA